MKREAEPVLPSADLEARLDAPDAEPPPLPGAAAEAAPAPAATVAEPSWSPTAAWPALPRSEAGLAPVDEEEENEAEAAATAVPSGAETQAVAVPSASAPESAGDAGADDRQGEPFAHLYAGDQRSRYLTALAAEGIFAVEAEALAATEDAPPAAVVPAGEERPTVTLGRLYLEQGHHAEAERIFAAVLARDADNGAAQLGMAQARASLALAGPDEERVWAPEADDAEEDDLATDQGWVLEEEVDEVPEAEEEPEAEEVEAAEQVLEVDPDPEAAAAPSPSEEPTLVLDPRDAAPAPAIPNQPRPYAITARQLLAGSDPESPPKVALMRAYLDRIVTRRAEGEPAPDVS